MIVKFLRRSIHVALLCLFGLNVQNAAAFSQEDVSTDSADVTLRGSLLVPDDYDGEWVALVIAGSGPTDRDGGSALVPGINNLKLLSEVLACAGRRFLASPTMEQEAALQ